MGKSTYFNKIARQFDPSTPVLHPPRHLARRMEAGQFDAFAQPMASFPSPQTNAPTLPQPASSPALANGEVKPIPPSEHGDASLPTGSTRLANASAEFAKFAFGSAKPSDRLAEPSPIDQTASFVSVGQGLASPALTPKRSLADQSADDALPVADHRVIARSADSLPPSVAKQAAHSPVAKNPEPSQLSSVAIRPETQGWRLSPMADADMKTESKIAPISLGQAPVKPKQESSLKSAKFMPAGQVGEPVMPVSEQMVKEAVFKANEVDTPIQTRPSIGMKPPAKSDPSFQSVRIGVVEITINSPQPTVKPAKADSTKLSLARGIPRSHGLRQG